MIVIVITATSPPVNFGHLRHKKNSATRNAAPSIIAYMAAHTAANQYNWVAVAPSEIDLTRETRASLPPIAGVILMDAWDIATDARALAAAGPDGRAAFLAGFDDVGHSLARITATDVYENVARDGAKWDIHKFTPLLAQSPTLTIYATHGGAEDNRRMYKAITSVCGGSAGNSVSASCSRLKAVELNSDHSFADSRLANSSKWRSERRSLPDNQTRFHCYRHRRSLLFQQAFPVMHE